MNSLFRAALEESIPSESAAYSERKKIARDMSRTMNCQHSEMHEYSEYGIGSEREWRRGYIPSRH